MIVGAGSGIGRATAMRFLEDDASIVVADRDAALAESTAEAVLAKTGRGIGVAGSGISGCGPATAIVFDATDRTAIQHAIGDAILAYGGLDELVVTAGLFPTPGPDGKIGDDAFRRTFDVNVLARRSSPRRPGRSSRAQALPASIVATTSVNAVVSKKGSTAYDASKAAANHLGAQPRGHARAARAGERRRAGDGDRGQHDVPPRAGARKPAQVRDRASRDDERRGSRRAARRGFYAERTLLKATISPRDQAEAIRFLAGPESSRTTGQVLHVDGGLADAFVR